MSWTCYTCQTVNDNKSDTCKKCGGNVAAPKSFYIHWVAGGAVFFFVMYLLGFFVGGILVEFACNPSKQAIMTEAKKAGFEAKLYEKLQPEELKTSKDAAIEVIKNKMSGVVKFSLKWILTILLFVLCGFIVGFISDGKTIVEAGLASVLGQIGGMFCMKYAFDISISYMVLGVGLVIGFGLAVLGSWLGEKVQDIKERAA